MENNETNQTNNVVSQETEDPVSKVLKEQDQAIKSLQEKYNLIERENTALKLSGKSYAGNPTTERPKELTSKEYADLVMNGKWESVKKQ
jgi:hypothetical protein